MQKDIRACLFASTDNDIDNWMMSIGRTKNVLGQDKLIRLYNDQFLEHYLIILMLNFSPEENITALRMSTAL